MKKIFTLLFFTFFYVQVFAIIRYVKPIATGTGDGSTWANASGNLQDIINAGFIGDQVWVAAGTYYPTRDANNLASPADNRTKTFFMQPGIAVYGGFAGNETVLTARNVSANITTLSGDLGILYNNTDNAYHVVVVYRPSEISRLDGFTITAGNANGNTDFLGLTGENQSGGGIFNYQGSGRFSLHNCIVRNNGAINNGAGMWQGANRTSIYNCSFITNNCTQYGGGLYQTTVASSTLENCFFEDNKGFYGGAIHLYNANTTLQNCKLVKNRTYGSGGAIYATTGGSLLVNNSCFTANYSNSNASLNGGAIFAGNTPTTINSCLFNFNTLGNNNPIYTSFGGAICFNGIATHQISNSTFYNNQVNVYNNSFGGAFYSNNATTNLKNNIFWNNTTTSKFDAGFKDICRGSGTVNLSFSDAQSVTFGTAAGEITNGGNNISDNPLFINELDIDGIDNILQTDDDGLQLSCKSPCYNTGNNTGVSSLDVLGNARIQSLTADMGAYENTALSFARVYVDGNIATSGDGSTWATAFKTLQEAFGACGTQEIWVKSGTYLPTHDIAGSSSPTDNRTKTFLLPSGIAIYGGFAGTETTLAQRNLALGNNSVLSGDLDNNDAGFTNNTNNAYHVLNYQVANANTLLNGFVVRGGNANLASGNNDLGGAMFCNGAGVVCIPKIESCVFTTNYAGNAGGAVFADGSGAGNQASPEFYSCIFDNNTTVNNGAAYSGNGLAGMASAKLINCNFTNNTLTNIIVANGYKSIVFTIGNNNGIIQNCVFSTNTVVPNFVHATPGSSVAGKFNNSTPTLAFGVDGFTGNPGFVNIADPNGTDNKWFTPDDGLILSCGSASYNSGRNTDITTNNDFIGQSRIQNTNADRGAYESSKILASITLVHVDAAVTSSGDGTTWATAVKTLQEAIDACSVNQIWVKKGTYYPTKDILGNSTPANNRTKTFLFKSGVAVYGGFAGTETTLAQRSLALGNNSILSGDLDMPADNTDNTYHLINYQTANTSTILNGFIIQDGNANLASTNNDLGGAIFCNGVGFSCAPKIQNCAFTNHNAANAGGAIFASGAGGGGYAAPEISNCVFTNNNATNNGSAISANGDALGNASPSVFNCTFANNTCPTAGTYQSTLFYYKFSNATAQNNIFYNNTADKNLVRGLAIGTMVITNNHNPTTASTSSTTGNPLFLNVTNPKGVDGLWHTADDGLNLICSSPCYNTGLNAGAPVLDILGNPVFSTTKDKGAYESEINLAVNAVTYVDAGIATSGDGTTWATALKTLQEGFDACGVTQIWVKQGTYYPTQDIFGNAVPANNRTKTFLMPNGVTIYGGFAGTETTLAQRNLNLVNHSILSGDFNKDDNIFANNTENALHVVTVNAPSLATKLDGFTITKGNANENTDYLGLIFMYGYSNCSGAGIFTSGWGQNFTLENAIVSNNNATYIGGGVYNNRMSPIFKNVVVHSNNAGTNGGGFSNERSNYVLINVVIHSNTSGIGGGIFDTLSDASQTNVTIYNNNASTSGGGVYNQSNSNAQFKNCIIWGNTGGNPKNIAVLSSVPSFTYCNIEGGYSGSGNINSNPLFVNPSNPNGADNIYMTADDGLRLNCQSPCYNVGTNIDAPVTDILGNIRPLFVTADMGAYESVKVLNTTTRFYVDASVSTSGTGETWASPLKALQEALDACSVTEVWVKKGTYYPTNDVLGNVTPVDNRTKTFLMKSGVSVYGGFAGTETLLTQRNWTTNATVLSGDLGTTGTNADNSYHVVAVNTPANATRLDGFTVRDGNANHGTNFLGVTDGNGFGGGLFAKAGGTNFTLTNVTISNNNATDGGGIYNYNSSPTITNVTVSNNNATTGGGGIYNIFSSCPILTNVAVSNNNASFGGGMYNFMYSSPKNTNCIFANNNATTTGGGMYNYDECYPKIKNCIIWGNTGTQGIENALRSSATVTYSCVQGGHTGNINTNPLFTNSADPDGADNIFMTADDGLALQCTSPCINFGDNTGAPALDILGNPIFATTKDMGAYEVQNNLSPTAPTPQVFVGTPTVANLTATGTNIKWYAANTGGTQLTNATNLIHGTTYYCSQSPNTCESLRTPVLVNITLPALFYFKPAQTDLTVLANWGHLNDGTGIAPLNFTTNGYQFILTSNQTLNGSLTLAAGTILQVGNAGNPAILTLNTNFTIAGTLNLNNGKLAIGNNTLTLNGDFVGTATNSLQANGQSNLVIGGTGAMSSNLFFDQTTPGKASGADANGSLGDLTPGVTNNLKNFTLNRTGQTITLGNQMQVNNTLAPAAGTLASNGNLVMLSTQSTTASILALGAGVSITGNVVVQSFFKGGTVASNRGFRMISNPTTATSFFQQIKDRFVVTCANIANLPAPATGCDFRPVRAPLAQTLVGYTEGPTYVAANFDNSLLPSSVASTAKGYYFFFRGNRASLNEFTAGKINQSFTAPEDWTAAYTGTINSGNKSIAVTTTGAGTFTGINLMGNPYPATLDISAFLTANASVLNNYISILNPLRTGFYTASGGVANGELRTSAAPGSASAGVISLQYIQPGQGFFVKANTAGTVNFTESQKASANNSPNAARLLSTNNEESVNLNAANGKMILAQAKPFTTKRKLIRLSVESTETRDDATIVLEEGNNANYNGNDAPYFNNSTLACNTLTADGVNTCINFMPAVNEVKKITIIANSGTTNANLKLNFNDLSGLDENDMQLVDSFTNTTTKINANNKTYNFGIDRSLAKSFAKNRFTLLFYKKDILPVKIGYFNATVVNAGVLLSWNTLSEQNAKNIVVETSADGITFSPICTKEVAGNSTTETKYNYTDTTPINGTVYYRLKKVDIDGSYKYSEVKTVNFDLENQAPLNIYPNPVIDELNLNWQIKQEVSIALYNITGKMIIQFNNVTNNNYKTNVANLTAGVYVIKLKNTKTNKQIAVGKFIKK